MRAAWLLPVLLGLCLAASGVRAQDRSVSGRVIDAESKAPVTGVSVLLRGTRLGDVTDRDGRYDIRRVPPGSYTLVFLHISYDTLRVGPVVVGSESATVRDVLLRPGILMMRGVTVEATRDQARNEPTLVSVRQLTPRTAKRMAGAAEDVFRSLQVLPGVLAQSEFDTRLYVRGGRPDQNLTLMDGISIYDPYRIFGLVTMFNPETVSEVRLLPGGFPARYGDRLSAVLDVTNRTGSTDTPLAANLNTSITNANLVLEGELPGPGHGSWLLSSRRTYYDLILKQFTDLGTFPNFWDLQGKFYYRFGAHDELQLNLVNSRESTDLLTSEADFGDGGDSDGGNDSLRVLDSQRQQILGAFYRRQLGSALSSETYISCYRNRTRTDFDATFTRSRFLFSALLDLHTVDKSIREVINWRPSARHDIEVGGEWHRLEARNTWRFYTDYPGVILSDLIRFAQDAPTTYRVGAYVQNTFTASSALTWQFGLRFDRSTMLASSVVSPRISLAWSLGALSRLRFAWGTYYQYPSYETLQGEGFRYDLQRVKELGIEPERAFHYLVGLERRLSDTWTLRVEGYYKDLDQLLVPARADTTWLVVSGRLGGNVQTRYRSTEYFTWVPRNAARGSATGLEVYVRKEPGQAGRLAGWISYALARVRSREQGRETIYLPYDQRHTANVVGEYRLSKHWSIGLRWQYGSGFPYTRIDHVVEVVGDRNGNGRLDVYEDLNANGLLDPGEDRNGNGVLDTVNPQTGYRDEGTAVVPDDLLNAEYGARYPSHHRLDVRINHSRSFWGARWLFYLDVINVYNHKNVQVYDYNSDFSEKKPVYGIPLVPTLGVSVRF